MFLALWGLVRVRFRLHWKALSPPFLLYGWRDCRLNRRCLAGRSAWFPESAIWAWPLVTNLGVYMRGSRWGQS